MQSSKHFKVTVWLRQLMCCSLICIIPFIWFFFEKIQLLCFFRLFFFMATIIFPAFLPQMVRNVLERSVLFSPFLFRELCDCRVTAYLDRKIALWAKKKNRKLWKYSFYYYFCLVRFSYKKVVKSSGLALKRRIFSAEGAPNFRWKTSVNKYLKTV